MSNTTLKKKRQKKSTKSSRTSSSRDKLVYSVKTKKKDKKYVFEVVENKTKVVQSFNFRDKAKDFADFHNKNQIWLVNGGIPKFLCVT